MKILRLHKHDLEITQKKLKLYHPKLAERMVAYIERRY